MNHSAQAINHCAANLATRLARVSPYAINTLDLLKFLNGLR